MRMLDEMAKRPTRGVLLMLTPQEAEELRDALEDLLLHPEMGHAHVDDADYRRTITVAIYTPENVGQFAKEVQALIEQDA